MIAALVAAACARPQGYGAPPSNGYGAPEGAGSAPEASTGYDAPGGAASGPEGSVAGVSVP